MNVRIARKHPQPRRGGFTLIELLVVISIIAVLASLILPGVQNAREAGRRITCLNNMKNVGLAALNYATANNGQLPPLTGDSYYTVGSATDSAKTAVPAPWTVHLLPYLDQAGLFERITDSELTRVGAAETYALTVTDIPNIKAFTCPNDQSADDNGALSFAANVGYISNQLWSSTNNSHRIQTLDTSSTPAVVTFYQWSEYSGEPAQSAEEYAKRTLATGVFWRQNSPGVVTHNVTNLKMTLDRMRDGTTQTLMFSENITNGGWLPAPQSVNGAATADLGFGFQVATSATGVPAMVLAAVGTESPASDQTKASRINSSLNSTGSIARAASLHPQVVNAIFCDGSARTLNQSINDGVYARLITPNGNTYRQAILSSNDF
jgi:prepilin-type N-terminal cleavage/methylation domain-containing protein